MQIGRGVKLSRCLVRSARLNRGGQRISPALSLRNRGSRHYRHRFTRLPPPSPRSPFEFPNESSPSPHPPLFLGSYEATTCYLSIVTCRRSTRVDAKHLPARKLVSTARGGYEGRGEVHGRRYRRLVLRRLNTFPPACYIISIRFFFHFLFLFSSFFLLSLSLFLFIPHRHCHFRASHRALPCLYIHTYAHTKRMLMRVSWNTRIGVTAQLIKRRDANESPREIFEDHLHPDKVSTVCHHYLPIDENIIVII